MCEAEYTCDEGQVLADKAFFEQESAARESSKKLQAPALIQVVQPAILAQAITQKSFEIAQKAGMAVHMAVSPETLAEVKKVRADLNRDAADLADQFKAVKAQVLTPWTEVEQKYNTEIRDVFRQADSALKQKISDVEAGITGACLEEMQAYFEELVKTEHLDWLLWDQLGIKISLTDAKQKTHKKIREAIRLNVSGIAHDVATIADHQDAAEIMAEYKRCLCLGQAISTVQDRHRRIEEEQKKREAWEAQRRAAQSAAAKVEAAAPVPTPIPTACPAPAPAAAPAAPEKVYKLNFSVTGTKPQLIEFKKMLIEYCEKEGLKL